MIARRAGLPLKEYTAAPGFRRDGSQYRPLWPGWTERDTGEPHETPSTPRFAPLRGISLEAGALSVGGALSPPRGSGDTWRCRGRAPRPKPESAQGVFRHTREPHEGFPPVFCARSFCASEACSCSALKRAGLHPERKCSSASSEKRSASISTFLPGIWRVFLR